MNPVVLAPPFVDPSSNQPPREACVRSSSISHLSEVLPNTPLGTLMPASRVGDRTDTLPRCHGARRYSEYKGSLGCGQRVMGLAGPYLRGIGIPWVTTAQLRPIRPPKMPLIGHLKGGQQASFG